LTVLAVVVVFAAIAGVYLIQKLPTANDTEAVVRALVEDFGARLQQVSLLAPRADAAEAIEREYGPFVTSALLTEWMNDPESALGRMTSSPWPDRIEVENVEMQNASRYSVRGYVIEVTSEGGGIGEVPTEAVRRPIMLVVEKVSNDWRISAVDLGAYPGDGEWKLSEPNAQGVQFMYPETLPTTFISIASPEGWPPAVVLDAGDYSCAEEQQRMIEDREYCVVETLEGAAGTTYRTYEYITAQGDFVARAKFTLRFPQCANYNEPQASACRAEQESFDVNGLADRITSSIRMQ
jgi:hypothetical protein